MRLRLGPLIAKDCTFMYMTGILKDLDSPPSDHQLGGGSQPFAAQPQQKTYRLPKWLWK
ncbi:hypothetical protein SBV1_310022 [Verrucomicrobia bacterium]|nr:hypothetical protein SBV1_310022 [Verrucomicrobiota bacterium]